MYNDGVGCEAVYGSPASVSCYLYWVFLDVLEARVAQWNVNRMCTWRKLHRTASID